LIIAEIMVNKERTKSKLVGPQFGKFQVWRRQSAVDKLGHEHELT